MRPRRRDTPRAGAAPLIGRSVRYRRLVNPFEPVKLFSDDQVESMHVAALGILIIGSGLVVAQSPLTRICADGASAPRRAAIASSSRRRWPTEATPISLKSSAVSLASRSASTSFSRNAR